MPPNIIKIDPAITRRFAKKSAKRKPRQISCRILIICEGQKTEPFYFKALAAKYKNQGIYVFDVDIQGIGQNTVSVVDYAIELRDKGKKINCEYDRVWAVFDKDSFSDAKFNEAINKAAQNDIQCAWSNEAFELWYMYHFHNITVSMSRANFEKEISKHVNSSMRSKGIKKCNYKYKKNDPDNFEIMSKYGSLTNAIAYAKQNSLTFNCKAYARHNPCTMVYKLVNQLIGNDKDLIDEVVGKL